MRKRWLTLTAALALAGVLAFSLQDVILRVLIIPTAYLGWLVGIYYHTLPQILIWALAVSVIILMMVDSLIPAGGLPSHKRTPTISTRGNLASLTDWIVKAPGGVYYKWLIANRLGRIARETLDQRDVRASLPGQGALQGKDWSPSEAIRSYLEAGLNGSFADYPRESWPWKRQESSPLDLDPQEVIAYLESQMEQNHDG